MLSLGNVVRHNAVLADFFDIDQFGLAGFKGPRIDFFVVAVGCAGIGVFECRYPFF